MEIIMTLKREWFYKIKSGEKSIEYREAKPYWDARLNKPITSVIFRNGYSANSPTIRAKVSKIEKIKGKNTDLKIDKYVYAIHLFDVIEHGA